jgi:hypothetical protein
LKKDVKKEERSREKNETKREERSKERGIKQRK